MPTNTNEVQKVQFSKQSLTFKVGTGKDAKIFIKFVVDENGSKNIYNIPLLTLNSIQIFSSKPKVPRYEFGSPDPRGLSTGVRNVSGYITATTLNESIGTVIRRKMKGYRPVEANDLNLNTDGVITIEELDRIRHLDQLPPCQIMVFLQNPETNKVFSKSVYGVVFSNESHTIGNSASMGEQYSFAAAAIGPIVLEDISVEALPQDTEY